MARRHPVGVSLRFEESFGYNEMLRSATFLEVSELTPLDGRVAINFEEGVCNAQVLLAQSNSSREMPAA